MINWTGTITWIISPAKYLAWDYSTTSTTSLTIPLLGNSTLITYTLTSFMVTLLLSAITNSKIKTLYTMQNEALQLICRDVHAPIAQKCLSTHYTSQINILPLPSLSTYFTALIGHQILNSKSPAYFSIPVTRSTLNNRVLWDPHKLANRFNYNKLYQHITTTFKSLLKTLRTLPPRSFRPHPISYLLPS